MELKKNTTTGEFVLTEEELTSIYEKGLSTGAGLSKRVMELIVLGADDDEIIQQMEQHHTKLTSEFKEKLQVSSKAG